MFRRALVVVAALVPLVALAGSWEWEDGSSGQATNLGDVGGGTPNRCVRTGAGGSLEVAGADCGGGGGSPGGASGDVQTNDGVGGFAGGQSLSSLATEAEVPGLVPTATTTTVGKVELATDGESAANVVVQGNDARMSNSRNASSITDGIIVNADVSPSAAIAGSKIQEASDSNAGVVSASGTQLFAGTKVFTGGVDFSVASEVVARYLPNPTLFTNGSIALSSAGPTNKVLDSPSVKMRSTVDRWIPSIAESVIPADGGGSWIAWIDDTDDTAKVQTLPLPATWLPTAGGAAAGIVSTGTQTFAGEKAFPGGLVMPFSGSFGSDPTLGSNGACAWDVDTPTGKSFGSNIVCHTLGGAIKLHAPMMAAGTIPASGSWIWGVNGTDSVPLTAPLANTWLDSELQALAGVTAAANTVPYFTSGSAAGVMDVSQTATNNSIVQRDASGGIVVDDITATSVTVSGGADGDRGWISDANTVACPLPASGQGTVCQANLMGQPEPSVRTPALSTRRLRAWIPQVFQFFEDFSGWTVSGALLHADSTWTYTVANTGAADSSGISWGTGNLRLNTGTNAAGAVTLSRTNGGTARFRIMEGTIFGARVLWGPSLCDATDDCQFVIGLTNDIDPTGEYQPTEGVWFEYDVDTSPNWLVRNTASSYANLVSQTSAVAVAANTGAVFEFRATGNGTGSGAITGIEFYINGTKVGSTSTTFLSNQDLAFMIGLAKEAGTSSRNVVVDFYGVEVERRHIP